MTRRPRMPATALSLALLWPAAAGAADYLGDAARLASVGNLPAARLVLRKAVQADPGNAAAHYRLGMIDLQLGDAEAAEKEGRHAQDAGYDLAATRSLLTSAYLNEGRARDLLRDFPIGQDKPEVAAATAVARGKAQLLLDHADAAEQSFAEARRLAPGSAAPLLAEAQLASSRGDVALTGRKIDAALAIAPGSAEALQLRAALLAAKGEAAQAIAASDQAVAAAPGQYAFRLDRAGVLIAFDQNQRAQADVDAVLSSMPGNARAVYYRVILLMRAGQFAAANADLDRLSTFVSQYPGAYLVQAVVKQQVGQTAQALDAAIRYVARSPGDVRGVVLLAQMQIKAKRPAKAIEVLTPLAEAGSGDPAIYDLRGTALCLLGRPADALADYRKALALRSDPVLFAHLGAAQLALHQPDAAIVSLQHSVHLAPAQPQTEALLTSLLLDAGSFDAARQMIDQLRSQQGSSETVGILTGDLDVARFDLPGARQAFEAVLREHPDSVPARLALARVALLQGRTEDRISLLGAVLQRAPALEPVVDQVADLLLRQGRTADATAVLERAHAAAPADPRFTVRLASLAIAAGDAQKAMILVDRRPADATDQAAGDLPVDASTVPLLMVRAVAQTALKQPEAAQATYRRLLAADPSLTLARIRLTRLLLPAQPAAARAVLEEGLAADPQNEQLLRDLVDLDGAGSGSERGPGAVPAGEPAAAALASAARLAQDPAHQPASLTLPGDLYMNAGQFDEAAGAYAAPMRDAPSTRLAIRLALARNAGGHAVEAETGLRDWLTQHPDDLDAKRLLSDLDIDARNLASAKALLADLVARRPDDPVLLNNLAWVDQQTQDPQAIVLARRAYRLAPGAQTADTLGTIMTARREGDAGVSLLQLATLQAPNQPAMKYHLALAYQTAGQPAQAVKLLTPLVAGSADFADKPKARQLLAALSGTP